MTKEQFKSFWKEKYPNTIPMSHSFRRDYPDRWFRIHSLPKSKRYPDNEEEWQILLERQNTIFTDVLGENSNVLIVTGDYHFEGNKEQYPIADVDSVRTFSFTQLDHIDLHKLCSEEYDQGQIYRPIFCQGAWRKNDFDNVLRDIAEDQLRAFFVSIDNGRIVAPYDGGIDFVLEDSETRGNYKNRYRDWLSDREDGL